MESDLFFPIELIRGRDEDTDTYSGETMWRNREKTAVYKPSTEAVGHTDSLGTWSRTFGQQDAFLLFKPPGLWYVVLTARANAQTSA